MKVKKRILTLFLALIMMATLLPTMSLAAGTVTITLAITGTAADEDGKLTEYENEEITLTATVEDASTKEPVDTGYLYFYRVIGTSFINLNEVPQEVKAGKAQITVRMPQYDTSKQKNENTFEIRATYAKNDSYGQNQSAPQEVLIRSTKINTPIIKASHDSGAVETTKENGIDSLPAGKPIEFSLIAPVTAMDGRELTEGVDFTLQWEQNSNQGMFVGIAGAAATPYNLASGSGGDSFRLKLLPAGHMTTGSTSQAATIGTLSNAEVSLDASKTYTPTADDVHGTVTATAGSHYGDEITLTAAVKGESAIPTGVVSFWYKLAGGLPGAEVQLGDYIRLEPSTNPAETTVAKASLSTTALPEGVMELYVKYHGDKQFAAEDKTDTLDAAAKINAYKVWSTEISNSATDFGELAITASDVNGNNVNTLIAGSTYTLTLATPIRTESGQILKENEYIIQWQLSENGVNWSVVQGAANSDTCVVSPENLNMRYRASVTTTYDLFADPKNVVPTRLDTEVSNTIGSNVQGVQITLSTDKSALTAPFTNAVYDGNEITIYAEVRPLDHGSTVKPSGKVQFFYVLPGADGKYNGTQISIESSDPLTGGSNEASIYEYGGKFFAAITTDSLPTDANGKMQTLAIVAKYMGNDTYDALETEPATAAGDGPAFGVTVYSSKVYVDGNVQNQVLPGESETRGIVIYAPEDVLVSDGTPTILTLKNLYTLDAENEAGDGLTDPTQAFMNLTEDKNYTIEWQYTTALDASDPAASDWRNLNATGHTTTVEPNAGYAYRAKITVDTTAERTVKAETVYYSNVLTTAAANAVVQLRVTPASSAAYKDTDIIFDAYVSGGTNVPAGDIELRIKRSGGDALVVDRSLTAVNGHVRFGEGTGDNQGKINLEPGVYNISATYTGNSGYSSATAPEEYIVRYKAEEVAVTLDEADYAGLVYNGAMQRPDKAAVTFNGAPGHIAAQAKADSSVVFNYEMKSGEDWVPVDAPKDAGTYRVTAVLPESIYYQAQTSETIEFTVAQKEVSVSNILVQAKVYNAKTDAYIQDVELTGVVHGDSVYAEGKAAFEKAEALVDNSVTFTAEKLSGPDAANYKFADKGDVCEEEITISRNLITVDSFEVSGTALTGLEVYDNYGTAMGKANSAGNYTVRYFYHDGTGVKETTLLTKEGKYTVVTAPYDTANYKGGETFIMNVAADGSVSFAGNDTAEPDIPGIITITDTQQVFSAAGNAVTATTSNGSTVTVSYNTDPAADAGRYGVTATAAGCGETHGILTIYKAEAGHIVPQVESKVYDGHPVDVANLADYTTDGTYFSYTGGEIRGVSYDAPKDVGAYTVTAHVPATANTVAYSETSTFEITKRDITVEAVNLTKERFRTNPVLRVKYIGLVDGDSDLKDMLALPSFELVHQDGYHDLNNVGNYTIVPSGIISRNYNVTAYKNGNFAVQETDPALTMEIVGLPNGKVYYGDKFQVSLYGSVGNRVDGNGQYNNPSSVIEYFVIGDGDKLVKDNGNVSVDENGNVSITGTAAENFVLCATRGTGAFKIEKTVYVDVEKRPVNIAMTGEDRSVYDGKEQDVDRDKYAISGGIKDDDNAAIKAGLVFTPAKVKDAGEYTIKVEVKDDRYQGVGQGLKTITQRPATVTTLTADSTENRLITTYGTPVTMPQPGYTHNAAERDVLLKDSVTMTDVRFNSDVGGYEVFTAGVENPNYVVTYISGEAKVEPKALTISAGVDDLTDNNKITGQVKREYGTENPQMGYYADGFITGDGFADLLLDKNFIVYGRKQEDDANLDGTDKDLSTKGTKFVNGHAAGDGYGLIDLNDATANINGKALNYEVTKTDGLLDIFQKNITVDVQNLKVKAGTELTNESYLSYVDRVLTEAPMNDKLADLGLTYGPIGTAGQGTCTNNAGITVALRQWTPDNPATSDINEYTPQNYYRTNTTQKGTLTVTDKAALADITADKAGAGTKTYDENMPANEYVLVYEQTIDNTDPANTVRTYTATEFYVKQSAVTGTANQDEYAPVNGLDLFTKSGDAYTDSTTDAGTTHFVKDADVKAVKKALIGVGDIDYVVIDSNGNKMAWGKMEADNAKPGEYSDNPYDNFSGTLAELPNGTYTIFLIPSGEYALQPTMKVFTVGGGIAPPPGPGPGPGPSLETEDHFAYMQGDTLGNFNPDLNMKRSEAAQVFYNLLVDKNVDTSGVSFIDVDSRAWYAQAVKVLAALGIINGYEDETFRPESNVTRAEFAALASRFDKLSTGTVSFVDVSETHWAYKFIVSAATKGWITGYEDKTFRPDNNITRAEVVTLINRVLGRTADKDFISKNLNDIKLFPDVLNTHWAYYDIIEATNGHDYTKGAGGETWQNLK